MMQFLVRRITQSYSDPLLQPCDGAYPGEVMADQWKGPPKLTDVWFIDISSLDELMLFFAKKEDKVIIGDGGDHQHVEIAIFEGGGYID